MIMWQIKKEVTITRIVAAFAGILLLFSLQSCYNDKAENLYPQNLCDTSFVTYSSSVVPILNSNCFRCHGGISPSSGIKLDDYTEVKQQVDNGNLWGSISHSMNYAPMPRGADMLSSCNLARIRIWIAIGAPDD